MNQVLCIGDTIKDMGCYGDPSAGVDGERCVNQHYHITPHFWDNNVGILGAELEPFWMYNELYPDGSIPCVDWCDNGAKPEYRCPCATQPPTTIPPTTGGPTIGPTADLEDCETKCSDEFYQ